MEGQRSDTVRGVGRAAGGLRARLRCERRMRGDDGRRSGRAPRGLYRFRVIDVTETAVVIGEVEEDVLLFF